jgi:CheY-like chemotaxis protein
MGHADQISRQGEQDGAPAAIQRASWHLLTLVENLLEQARQGEGAVQLNPGPVQLAPLLDDMNDLFSVQAAAKDLALRIAEPPCDVRLQADELRLRQVLINLISNAIRYTREGHVNLDVRFEDDALVFRVEDTGPGIEKGDRERIFQPFMRLHPGQQGGAGLGLSITRQLIEAMGGTLGLDSEPGQGSTFSFSLPVSPAAGEELPADLLAGLRVLLVDDDPDVLAVHELYLQDWGMRVHSVTSLTEACALLREHNFDLVFTDQHLEEGSGTQLLQAVNDQDQACRTILCSGSGVTPGWEQELGGVADAFLLKPVTPDQLRATISRLLSKAPN